MVYKQTEMYTCGPAAYLEAFCWRKTRSKELKFHELGRIKPSKAFLGVSFLLIDPRLKLYITHKYKLSSKFINLVYGFEDFKNQGYSFKELEKELSEYYSALIRKERNRVKKIFGIPSIIELINQTVKVKKKALLLTNSSYWLGEIGVLHWVVVKGKDEEGKFICSDPFLGEELHFSEKEIKEQMLLVEKERFPLQIVLEF
jgi:hypothetical protein